MKLDHSALGALFVLTSSLAACAATGGDAPEGDENTDDSGRSGRAIVGGSLASAYAEAVLVDMKQNGQVVAMCSGSLIAPQVVLTAGHCVHGMTGWNVKAPYAGGQQASSTSGTTLDWTTAADTVDPTMHDVGLVFLSTPITLASYPKLAQSPLAAGSSIVNIGRINNGTLSNTNLYVSKLMTISAGASAGYAFDYVANEIIESGDSGGPDMQAGTHTIVAVNSGAGGGTEVLARIDLVYSWVQQQIAAHGGNGPSGSSSSSGGGAPAACAHALCSGGGKLSSACDPCATSICGADPYCCQTAWDGQCVAEVGTLCGKTCGGGSSSGSSSSSSSSSGGSAPGSSSGGASSGGGGCGGITYAGTCEGSTLEWCNGGSLVVGDCAAKGQTCGWSAGAGYYDCL